MSRVGGPRSPVFSSAYLDWSGSSSFGSCCAFANQAAYALGHHGFVLRERMGSKVQVRGNGGIHFAAISLVAFGKQITQELMPVNPLSVTVRSALPSVHHARNLLNEVRRWFAIASESSQPHAQKLGFKLPFFRGVQG